MPGYIRGYVEREFADRWELVCRVDPFTGSQGAFKYVLFGTRWAAPLGPVVHTKGFPEDLAPATILAMLGRRGDAVARLSDEDLDHRFAEFRESLSNRRHVTLAELRAFDWDATIDDEAWDDLAARDPEQVSHDHLRLFDLVDTNETVYEDWTPDDADPWRHRLWGDDDAVAALLSGDWIEFDDRRVSLEPRSRRAMLPEAWFGLLDLLEDTAGHRDVRFTCYWHH